MFLIGTILGQDYPESHIPESHLHDSNNCYGYALGRANGKTSGDAFCDPRTTFAYSIPSSFPFVEDSELEGIKVGDIVVFGEIRQHPHGHAAYVVSVPDPLTVNNIGNIRVDQVPYESGTEQTYVELSDVIYEQGQGQPVGYHIGNRGNKIRTTFRNSFEHGILHAGQNKFGVWITVSHGESELYSKDISLPIEAIDQEYGDYMQRYQEWQRDKDPGYSSLNPLTVTVDNSRTYSAVFAKEFNIEFQNDFDGTGGGQIKVQNVIQNAPYIAHVLKLDAITAQALDGQVINSIIYNFDHWQDGNTTNPRTFAPVDHATITAYFKAELHVFISGPTYRQPDQIGTFTANPAGGTGTYTNYKWWKRTEGGVEYPKAGYGDQLSGDGDLIEPMLYPPGVWIEQTRWEGSLVITQSYPVSFSLKCRVYDSNNDTAEDTHYIFVPGGGDPYPNPDVNPYTLNVKLVPTNVTLENNYPNPFNPTTTIQFGLPETQHVKMSIYSLQGKKVATLVDGIIEAGFHQVRWDGKDSSGRQLTSGIYIYLIESGKIKLAKKMIFTK